VTDFGNQKAIARGGRLRQIRAGAGAWAVRVFDLCNVLSGTLAYRFESVKVTRPSVMS